MAINLPPDPTGSVTSPRESPSSSPKDLTIVSGWVRRIRHLYKLRGEVTHGGKQQILASEVAELQFYVLNVINVMIRNPEKWDSRQALREWIEDQRLS
jgi:hypothetical protein